MSLQRARKGPAPYPKASMLVVEILLMAFLNAVIDTIIVLVILSRRTERMMGVAKVKNSEGEIIYAPLDPDGKPLKVPVARAGEDGKVKVTDEYVGLAWALPTMAAASLKAQLMGKAGKMVQTAEAQILEGMPLEQASAAIAMQALAKGQIGKAFMAWMAPKIAASINASGQAGQSQSTSRSGGRGPI